MSWRKFKPKQISTLQERPRCEQKDPHFAARSPGRAGLGQPRAMVIFDDGPVNDLKCISFPHTFDPFPETKASVGDWGKVIHHKYGQIAA
jgi:hypothetical protein